AEIREAPQGLVVVEARPARRDLVGRNVVAKLLRGVIRVPLEIPALELARQETRVLGQEKRAARKENHDAILAARVSSRARPRPLPPSGRLHRQAAGRSRAPPPEAADPPRAPSARTGFRAAHAGSGSARSRR